jgi:F-type H+-transporting ATPase subunit epsilon
MAKPFQLQVFTQERKVLEQDVVSLSAPGAEGYFGVLADHAPLVSVLGKGTLKVTAVGGAEKTYQVSGGFLEVAKNQAVILADSLTDSK